ncbi:ShlB/FhaC/HecB family hemolysin secretion/activation protein [Seongchinamella sediminis]|nr:ShlB/FhaC/HecB family hemolysin secretion/activation protein [Seongchinamella sediminis]
MFRLLPVAIAPLIAITTPGVAASPYPNSGLLYQDVRDDRLRQQPRRDVATLPDAEVLPDSEVSQPDVPQYPVEVAHFAVYGNQSLEDSELSEVLAPFSHRTLSPRQLIEAAAALRLAYRQKGFFLTQVYIPPQAIEHGIVTLHVYEGVLEENGVELDDSRGDHVSTQVVESVLAESLATGSPLHRDDVERSILLVDDLPGITSHSVIYPGEDVGAARFLMRTENTPSISGNIDVDNFGNYYTGEERLGATVYVNSPSGAGDQLTFRGVTSGSDSNYVFLDYSRPVGARGWRMGANVDYLDYAFGEGLSQSGSEGKAASIRLFASYPVVRTRHSNLSGRVEYAFLDLEDDGAEGRLLADRRLQTVTAGIAGDHDDDRWASGITYYKASVTAGSVDIRGGEFFEQFDYENVDTDGGFARVNVELSRLQHISGFWSAYGALAGQWASSNLDTSQKFYIGGPFSVPGYPTGQAGGDHGANLHGDLRYDFVALPWGGSLQASLFYAYGWTQLFEDPWDGWEGDNPFIKNNISLQSWGVGLTQTWGSGLILRASAGRQVGSNDSRNPVTAEDADGSDSDYRAWMQVIYYF